MQPVHARYPFFEAAREAVATADVSLPTLVASDAPAVERGRERVERALLEGTVATEADTESDIQTELLSYPIARILVSMLDSSAAVEKYAAAEARTAIKRLRADVEAETGLQSVERERVSLLEILREFDVGQAVREQGQTNAGPTPVDDAAGPLDTGSETGTGSRTISESSGRIERRRTAESGFRITVGQYLALSSPEWGSEWRLVGRDVAGGEVAVSREELFDLVEAAIRDRILDGLPFDLPADEGIAAELEAQIDGLHQLLKGPSMVGEIDRVVPELFPPCMENLIQKAERGTHLDPPERFTLMAFLTGIGMDADEIIAFCAETSLDSEGIRYQTEYLRSKTGTQYPPPSCETLAIYEICHNEDDHWKEAGEPLAYYQRQLDETDQQFTDWRERP